MWSSGRGATPNGGVDEGRWRPGRNHLARLTRLPLGLGEMCLVLLLKNLEGVAD